MIIFFEEAHLQKKAEQLGQQLKLPVQFGPEFYAPPQSNATDHALVLTRERLELRQLNTTLGPLFVDFTSDALAFRVSHASRKKEALARAVGLKKNRTPVVFDLTAGLGRDAFILASLGCDVHLFERNQVVAALLADALLRAADSVFTETVKLMTLHQGDAMQLIEEVAMRNPPEVSYIDPMFPHRKKSALVKKEMRMVRQIVGDDQDSARLFEVAINYSTERVVCKRPKQAPMLSPNPPDLQVASKKHRFDIYFRGNRKVKG